MNSYFTKRLVMYFSVRENLIASAGFLLVAVVVLVGCYAWLAPESARPFVAVADVTQTQSADNLAMAPVTATPVIIEEKKLPVTASAQRLLISATPLAIVLVGIVDSNDASLARAVIEFKGQQQLYGVGAKLPMGDKVFVKNVLVDRVIIENNGQLDTVFMYVGDAARGKYNTPTGSTPTAPMTPELAQWYADHEEPAEPLETEAAQAEEIRQAQENPPINITPPMNITEPVSPEMAQWLLDHAADNVQNPSDF